MSNFTSLTRKTYNSATTLTYVKKGKGNFSLFPVRGSHFENMAAIFKNSGHFKKLATILNLKNWHPFENLGKLNLTSLTRKTLEKCYYTNICDEGNGNSSILHGRGSHLAKLTLEKDYCTSF